MQVAGEGAREVHDGLVATQQPVVAHHRRHRDGEIFWNIERLPDIETLVRRLKLESVKEPQPEVHIRGDQEVRYESVGRVVVACQRAGIFKVGFITEPPAGAAARQ